MLVSILNLICLLYTSDNLDPVVDLVDILFSLEYAKGMEARILEAGFKRMDLFKD